MLGLTWLRGALAQKHPNGVGVELFFSVDVPIEGTARQTSVLHDLVDRDFGEPLPVEQSAGALKDPLSRVLLVLG